MNRVQKAGCGMIYFFLSVVSITKMAAFGIEY